MLCLAQNLRFEVHKALHLPRNLRFEVHKALCLPRNLHFEVHKVLCLPQYLHFKVHQRLDLPRNLHFEVHQVLCLPRNLHFEVHKVLRLSRNLQRSHMSKSHDALHLSRSLSSSTITTMSRVQSAAPATKLHFEVKQLRTLAPVTKSRLWSTKTQGFPCACHEKLPPCTKMRTAPQRERSR